MANGAGEGNAGSISLVTQSGDLVIGKQAGAITISAVSGIDYSSTFDGPPYPVPTPIPYPCNLCAVPMTDLVASTTNTSGSATSNALIAYPFYPFGSNYTGKVFISVGGNLTVDPSALSAGPAKGTITSCCFGSYSYAANANGAEIYLIAGTGSNGGNLLVTGSLSANGSGNGNGGRILLAGNSQDTFVVSQTASGITNGVEGTISANGVNGGSILLATAGLVSSDSGAIRQAAAGEMMEQFHL